MWALGEGVHECEAVGRIRGGRSPVGLRGRWKVIALVSLKIAECVASYNTCEHGPYDIATEYLR